MNGSGASAFKDTGPSHLGKEKQGNKQDKGFRTYVIMRKIY